MNKETRIAEIRVADEEKMIIEGYAVRFDEETLIGTKEHGFIETISRGSLTCANMKDVPLKYNHQDNYLVLARTRNKSLELSIDEVGLKVKAELLDTQSNRDIYKMVKNGLLDKMSFAFTVEKQQWNREGKIPIRSIEEIDRLYDVSIVDVPAYDGTSVYARSMEMFMLENNKVEVEANKRSEEILRKKIKIKGEII